jgi:hypothetical protein
MLSFIKRVIRSRVGHLLLVINLCILLYGNADSAASYHIHRECVTVAEAEQMLSSTVCFSFLPLWIIVLLFLAVLLELPSIILASLFTEAFESLFPHICAYTASQVDMVFILLISTAQWMLVGYAIECRAHN